MSIALLQNVGKNLIDEMDFGPNNWEAPAGDLADFECLGWRCVAHTLHLAIMDCLHPEKGQCEGAKKVIKEVRDIVLFVKVTVVLTTLFLTH